MEVEPGTITHLRVMGDFGQYNQGALEPAEEVVRADLDKSEDKMQEEHGRKSLYFRRQGHQHATRGRRRSDTEHSLDSIRTMGVGSETIHFVITGMD